MSHADRSDSSLDSAANPTFDQLNVLLISRGYTAKPIIIPAGTSIDTIQTLSNAIHSLLAQRDEDISVREQLSAHNRTLSATVDRLKRAVDLEMRKSEDLERKLEGAKTKIDSAVAAHASAVSTHKQTQADLVRARTELQGTKVAAHQYRLSINRSSERLKSKMAETSLTALRSVVPSLRIATGAFSDYKGVRGALMQAQAAAASDPAPGTALTSSAGNGVVIKEQLKELEEERAGLLQSTEVLKRMATEAVNALRAVDRRLHEIEAEESAQGGKETSSVTPTSGSVKSLKRSAQDAFGNDASEGLSNIAYEDLFPRAHPLRAAPVLAYVAAEPGKTTRRSRTTTSSTRSKGSGAPSGPSRTRSSSNDAEAAEGGGVNAHPAAIALQESISSLYARLDQMEQRQAEAAAAARAAARAAKRARTLKSPGPSKTTAAAVVPTAAGSTRRSSSTALALAGSSSRSNTPVARTPTSTLSTAAARKALANGPRVLAPRTNIPARRVPSGSLETKVDS